MSHQAVADGQDAVVIQRAAYVHAAPQHTHSYTADEVDGRQQQPRYGAFLMFIIPLPSWLLDIFMAFNIAIAFTVLYQNQNDENDSSYDQISAAHKLAKGLLYQLQGKI